MKLTHTHTKANRFFQYVCGVCCVERRESRARFARLMAKMELNRAASCTRLLYLASGCAEEPTATERSLIRGNSESAT